MSALGLIVTPLGWVAIVTWVVVAPVAGILGARAALRAGEGPGWQRLLALDCAVFWPIVLAGWAVWKALGGLASIAAYLERRGGRG